MLTRKNGTKKSKRSFLLCIPSKETPVPAMLDGRGLRVVGIDLLVIKPDVDIVVDVDMELPGLDVNWPPGVTLPEREPK